jgi:cold shock CspA family protein
MSDQQEQSGIIKRLEDRGFGFIKTASGADVFFHVRALRGIAFEALREGMAVRFVEGQDDHGRVRAHIVRLDRQPSPPC